METSVTVQRQGGVLRAAKNVGTVFLCLLLGFSAACSEHAGDREGRPAPSSTGAPKAPFDKDQVRAAMPDVADLPPGWKEGEEGLFGRRKGYSTVAEAYRRFRAPEFHGGPVDFRVMAYESRAAAAQEYTRLKSKGKPGSVHLPRADVAYMSWGCFSHEACFASIRARVGPALITVNLTNKGPTSDDPRLLTPSARMLIERVRQAQDGQHPSARTG
ncbi:hypothetical protein [Streptomyces sp. NPDC058989]|uniref:hypothetical protein n=1 Tax=Streptomyces sp. NPDC058989 TaxID=3346686 RepID=UPI00369659BB